MHRKPLIRHLVLAWCGPKFLFERRDKMAGVGVPDVKGHFIHGLASGIEHAPGMVESCVHDEPINRISIDFLESHFEAVSIETCLGRKLGNGRADFANGPK